MRVIFILSLLFVFGLAYSQKKTSLRFDFYSGPFTADADSSLIVNVSASVEAKDIIDFYDQVSQAHFQPVVDSLLNYKNKHQLNDWLYYQLVRKTAQEISPKADNYARYTLYKWFLLTQSGYDARLAITPEKKIIFYIYNNEDISDIPFFMVDGKKYMCLNYHDYANTDLHKDPPFPVDIPVPGAIRPFSYLITRLPDFSPDSYVEKKLQFNYGHNVYNFEVKLNPEVKDIFANYPGVDFSAYFNIPLSRETYASLIPVLKKNIKEMDQVKGIDYLMRFTRYAFLYEDDEENYGKEKRLSPEETLFADYSDCDDRAALFFYLVKEIYDLPMIAILYPTHITIAVQFDKPVGDPIKYGGKLYSVCEPTLQKDDLPIGHISSKFKKQKYQVVYSYEPARW
ncbi:hypothetical protein EOD41_06605 [Mucilaginibacter limnophilus]|uniref:Transglutaminase domain-containing protein n=1 Tax=Mucilaginibacter limnophilus TaxID=1932778 RepID=A0A3S2Y209_9SPHI|nr:hypothetical protein [Mucilaginibacter limnophilus]RVU01627.1 hypothetical protein EOD41_06605 [Mucilaginibacter limnophilus]